MRSIKTFALFLTAISFVSLHHQAALSHSGRTNRSGCHNNRQTGGYHCHNSGSGSRSSYYRRNYSDPTTNNRNYKQPNSVGVSSSCSRTALTDTLFYSRHPELEGRKIKCYEQDLKNEWLRIYNQVNC